MCRGGGGTNLLYLLCLISNTMPQLKQSSLQPSTDHHRHLQTTSYNHLLLLHLLSRKGKLKQQQARNPPSRGVEKPGGPSALQPTTENRILVLGFSKKWIFFVLGFPRYGLFVLGFSTIWIFCSLVFQGLDFLF